MEKTKRRSVEPVYSMCVQPSFIIGTNNEDGPARFLNEYFFRGEVVS